MGSQLRDFLITVLVVTFVFAFDDKQAVFQLGPWLRNFLQVALGVVLVVLVHYFGHKWAARRYGTDVVHRLWGIKRFGLHAKAHLSDKPGKIHSIPLGSILSVVVAFISNGRFFFTAVESIEVEGSEYKRIGRWKLKVLEREIARIAFAGPAANMLFAFVLQSFNKSGMFDQLVMMNCLYALYHMIPWSQLDGAKIFFGSLYLYIFGLAFLLLSFLLLMLLPPAFAFFLSVIGAGIIFIFFFLRIHLAK
ncbi:hypothetical protein FJZ53_02735 [Candidatus Woesearchaeota archaeon]|nr:hypothetical protein [Candidatus Woesearchaeota archaeon]